MNVKKVLSSVFVSLLFFGSTYSWGASLKSVYPYNGQTAVYGSSRILISFTDPIDTASLAVTLSTEGTSVPGTLSVSSDNLKATFTPSQPLMPGATYQVILSGVVDQNNAPVALPPDGLASVFTTGTWRVESGQGVTVATMDPAPGDFYDTSVLRVQFSEPVDPLSVVYGTSFNVVDVSAGGTQVPGSLLVNGSDLVFQPDSNFTGGDQYRIMYTSGIEGINGEPMIPQSVDVYPIATASILPNVPFITNPDIDTVGGNPGLLPTSGLVDLTDNTSRIYSRLMGTSNTYLHGTIVNDLNSGSGSDIATLVIPKGQVIQVTGIPVQLAGKVGTGLSTGTISMTLIDNGTGRITVSPFSSINPNASYSTYLTLDVCVTAQNGLTNSILNQDVMNLKLYGETDLNTLSLNAVGEVELNIMGGEKALVVISQNLLLDLGGTIPVDTTPPVISSVYPTGTDIGVNAPVIVTFSKPLQESSLAGRIQVMGPGGPVAGSLRTDGSSVLFTPDALLAQNTNYTVSVNSGIQDINGNALITGSTTVFTTEPLSTRNSAAVMVSSISPGVPCVLNGGTCSLFDMTAFGTFLLPSNRTIEVYFTKPVNPSSINASSFSVLDADTNTAVPGSRIVSYDQVTFVPNDPWIPGEHYRLTLVGGPRGGQRTFGWHRSSTGSACGSGVICGTDGLPLNTDILSDGETPGGPNMVIPFVGGAYSPAVALGLTMFRTTDTNSNGLVDSTETRYAENSTKMRPTLGVINDRSYLSGAMLSSIGAFDPATNSIPLVISAGNWMFGTSTTLSILIISLSTGRVIIRPTGDATGYISSPSSTDPDQRPVLNVTLHGWINVVNGLVEALLQKSPVTMKLTGRIDFLPDGQMEATLTNTNRITLSAILLFLNMNPGDIQIHAVSAPVKLISLYQ